ncbi:histone acetyltransferase type B catalytic subunit-like [Telopea speciosissima]|uniref:histone acetyltransferase type B catalytic subunit-like n=1 Tax=Telopea speciosissima TaxID=54955 RepID=UPI001CC33391|nr:histone acetyltransferase type B catalytic subunit-like [Telopea speciosissima]
MGLKQATADASSDAKKRRRVGFSEIDVGIEANECLKIFMVSSKEEVNAASGSCIDPVDLNRFFGEDGKIYGYKDLKITISLSSISFHAYADIKFQSSSEGGKGITDLKSALQAIFGESLLENKEDFLQTFSTESCYIRTSISNGKVIDCKASQECSNKSNNHLESEANTVERQVIRLAINSLPVGLLYSRLVPLVLLLVDGSSPIDITDPRWEIYLVVQKTLGNQEDVDLRLLGFAAVYRFYRYPDSSRLRISQILVLPPYQGQGHGRYLLEVLHEVAISENVYDVTVEEPSDYLQHVRTCMDMLHLLDFDPVHQAVKSVVSHLNQGNLSKKTSKFQLEPPASVVENVRKSLKINKKQFLQCWEVLIYLGLDPVDKYMENYMTFISERTKADILGKDSGTAGKHLIDVPNGDNIDITFVMFQTQAGGGNSVEIDKNQTNQEEALRQLVDDRVKEIVSIAMKVSSLQGVKSK